MRLALAIGIATLTLGSVPQPMHGQMPASDAPALETIQMANKQTGWAVTNLRDVGILLRTTDGGIRWRDVTPPRTSGHKISVWKIAVLSSDLAWVVPADTTGTAAEIFRTVDGGRMWRSAAIQAPAGFIAAPGVKSISFINPREGWLMATVVAYMGDDEVEIYHSSDGGDTWVKVSSATRDNASSGLPTEGGKTAIAFLNPTTGWVTGLTGALAPDRLYLYVTHDGGRAWRQQNVPLPRELTPHWIGFPQPPKFFTARDGILPTFYTLLNDSLEHTGMIVVLYATHDSGATWTYTVPLPVSSEVVHHEVADMKHAWVMSGGVLHATNDGGRRWAKTPPNPLFADVTQLDFISPQIGWAVRKTFPYGGGIQTFPFLLKTVDGGSTWIPVTYTISR